VSFKVVKRILLLLCTVTSLLGFALRVRPLGFEQSKPLAQPHRFAAHVPFVGCEADGQAGFLKAPMGKSKLVSISADSASRLAYYKSEQSAGVLAPRGWSCLCVYGSSGSDLFVSPKRVTVDNVYSSMRTGFAGPAIELASEDGDTSGRFTVAQVIARVFPAYKSFVQRVIAEDSEPASSYPFGPYPEDKLTYRSGKMVEYVTPANTKGLGTELRLKKNAYPIHGVAILIGETPDLIHLAVRLPPDLTDLAAPIIQQLEHDAERSEASPPVIPVRPYPPGRF